MLISNPRGNFQFTRGSAFYSSAVLADPGFQIVRAIFEKPVPLNPGFDALQRELQSCGRPMQALCGMELRAEDPYANRPLFMDFNSKYVERLIVEPDPCGSILGSLNQGGRAERLVTDGGMARAPYRRRPDFSPGWVQIVD